MSSDKHSHWFALLGLGFAAAGVNKLIGVPGYDKLAKHWGWSRQNMRTLGAVEFTGGLLVATPVTRRLGGAVLSATSAYVMAVELQHRDEQLSLARGGLLLAAMTALLPGSTSRAVKVSAPAG